VVGFVSLDAAGSARKPASPWIIGRFAPKPLMHFLYAGFVKRPRSESSVASRNPGGSKDVRIKNAGSRATQSRQSRQVRKEATVTG
jgi:hypothetical protein